MWILKLTSGFSAAHFLKGYHGRPADLHGHNFEVHVKFKVPKLSNTAVGVERRDLFRCVYAILKELDHKTLNDIEPFDKVNPTPEILAQYICEGITEMIQAAAFKKTGITVHSVMVNDGTSSVDSTYFPTE